MHTRYTHTRRRARTYTNTARATRAPIYQPLKAIRCPDTNKDFIVCDYNRDGDSFRSPWSNKYTPPLDDGNRMCGCLSVRAFVCARTTGLRA